MKSTLYWDKVPNRFDWLVPFAIALLSLIISAYVGYVGNDKNLAVKVRAVEVQQTNDMDSLKRIESKVDRLDDKVDNLDYKLDVILAKP